MALSKFDVANMVTGAVPVANGGKALTSGFVNGLTMLDQWRLTTNIEDSQAPISTNLAQATGNGAVNIGSSMSQSSGVFTFPSTGIYLIIATGMFDEQNSTGANVQMTMQIKLTTDNYNLYNSDSWWLEVEENSLILFPSSLTHAVEKIKTDLRVSLSFNTFLKGNFGDSEDMTGLKLEN